jgi:hypothetical protein
MIFLEGQGRLPFPHTGKGMLQFVCQLIFSRQLADNLWKFQTKYFIDKFEAGPTDG